MPVDELITPPVRFPYDQDDETFKVHDVVYCEGTSAIIGDVIRVDEDGVRIQWRLAITTEQPEDLVLCERPSAASPCDPRLEPREA